MSYMIKLLSDWLISKLSLCTTFILIRIVFSHSGSKSYPEVPGCTSINTKHYLKASGSLPALRLGHATTIKNTHFILLDLPAHIYASM